MNFVVLILRTIFLWDLFLGDFRGITNIIFRILQGFIYRLIGYQPLNFSMLFIYKSSHVEDSNLVKAYVQQFQNQTYQIYKYKFFYIILYYLQFMEQ